MKLSNKPIEYREKLLGNTKLLQYRIKPSSANNIFEWLYIKVFHNWHYTFICVKDPDTYDVNEQELAFDAVKCGKYKVPTIDYLKEKIKTKGEFDKLMSQISELNMSGK